MPEQISQNGVRAQETPEGITKITVSGYKSIAQEQSIEIRPLTILAGANSSGKSSIMQPLLLLKQTLEAPYDSGALLLDGPSVKFSSASQLFSHREKEEATRDIVITVEAFPGATLSLRFHKQPRLGIDIYHMEYGVGDRNLVLHTNMTNAELTEAIKKYAPVPMEENMTLPLFYVPRAK